MTTSRRILLFFAVVSVSTLHVSVADAQQSAWSRLVQQDGPVLWWSFDGKQPAIPQTIGKDALPKTAIVGDVKFDQVGPTTSTSPLFAAGNRSIEMTSKVGVIKVTDPGEKSLLDFNKGDAITIEAWVKPDPFGSARYMYVVGKGRTYEKGFSRENHNYSLRLQGKGSEAVLSFLFRSRGSDEKSPGDWHRWTSKEGFKVDKGWHHIAITYEFGKKNSVAGYVDGQSVSGVWDMGGATDRAPVVDDDQLWIGSSMGMGASSSFDGLLDEVAIYRKALTPERFQARVPYFPKPSPPPMPQSAPPRDEVLVEVIEGIPDQAAWPKIFPEATETWKEPAFAFFGTPQRYSSKGLRVDRGNPLILRASSLMTLPAGKYNFLVRTLRFGRLFIDGKLVVETPQRGHRGGGHGQMYDLKSTLAPGSRELFPGAVEKVAEFELDGKEHEYQFEVHAGGQGRRIEFGETSVSFAPVTESSSDADRQVAEGSTPFRVLSTQRDIPMTNRGWEAYERTRRTEYVSIDQQRRDEVSGVERHYWHQRHEIAQQIVGAQPQVPLPKIKPGTAIGNDIDRFILARLQDEGVSPAPLCDDWTFMRRVSLHLIGTPPSPDLVEEFVADKSSDRRAKFIDRLLEHPGWADHWVGYWQDVLAENPNVINPTLNNTGPFRWWIFESFLDNKPFDRFATELISMEGSRNFGGPAGFEMASQNDAPFAAKAHIISQGFLALEMKCARCHDAPYHDFEQEDLFSIAAMLKRSPQKVPRSSTIPGGKSNSELVKVSLKPEQPISAKWPFAEKVDSGIPDGILSSTGDSRLELAARVTSPLNTRFAEVLVNRLWHRYLGRGLVISIDDWETESPSHPELLQYLAREFVLSGYDVKQLARLILNSHTYQRQFAATDDDTPAELFASPSRQRLTAEQLVDTLFATSGKEFRAGDMNIDIDGSREIKSSLNLGIPRRAWMFSSMSNERDRPSLTLPYVAPFVSTLETFGWRSSRQSPLTIREEAATVLQPAIIANGTLGRRFTRLSDDSAFTMLALQDQPASELVTSVFVRVLTRPPNSEERAVFVELLSDGYAERINRDELNKPLPPLPSVRTGVGWSNHLHPDASTLQVETHDLVAKGDAPTKKLTSTWRERFEDMLWSLMNSPEFVFAP
ncbi:MAG: DUF1553 domain-containing protein [Rhodopirellula sp.]|nr:DUF1553 domain-containing protein [Rhodopirellula sp.]